MCRGFSPKDLKENHCILGFKTQILIEMFKTFNGIVSLTLWKCTSLSTASVGRSSSSEEAEDATAAEQMTCHCPNLNK